MLCLRPPRPGRPGDRRLSSGDHDLAIPDLNAAIRLAPGLARLYLYRALVYERKGLKTFAVFDLRNAFSRDPNDPDIEAKMREMKLLK